MGDKVQQDLSILYAVTPSQNSAQLTAHLARTGAVARWSPVGAEEARKKLGFLTIRKSTVEA